jgi:hypothetical protein
MVPIGLKPVTSDVEHVAVPHIHLGALRCGCTLADRFLGRQDRNNPREKHPIERASTTNRGQG